MRLFLQRQHPAAKKQKIRLHFCMIWNTITRKLRKNIHYSGGSCHETHWAYFILSAAAAAYDHPAKSGNCSDLRDCGDGCVSKKQGDRHSVCRAGQRAAVADFNADFYYSRIHVLCSCGDGSIWRLVPEKNSSFAGADSGKGCI